MQGSAGRCRHNLVSLAVFLLCCCPLPVHAGIDISSWDLLTFTQDRSGDIPVTDFEGLSVVENPFHAVSSTAVGPNTATTTYDFAWMLDAGTFDIRPPSITSRHSK